MNAYRAFEPDLIVEATSVCDRQCSGCYAPNVISRENPLKLLADRPDLFLAPARLEEALRTLSSSPDMTLQTIGIRGGEPTRHPAIAEILRGLKRHSTAALFLETHGRWIMDKCGDECGERAALLAVLLETGTTVKLSFDRMHGLSAGALQIITRTLAAHGIQFCIAITEPDDASFTTARESCAWIADDRIIFQRKADAKDSLVRPKYAVIRTDGRIFSEVSTRPEFKTVGTIAPLSFSAISTGACS
ncbi:radical SAM protein [Bdellovibrionota bacterium FG-1]